MYLFTLYVLSSVLRIQSLYASVFLGKCFHFDIHLLTALLSFRKSNLFPFEFFHFCFHILFTEHFPYTFKEDYASPNEIAVTARLNIYVKLTTTCRLPYMHLLKKKHIPKF